MPAPLSRHTSRLVVLLFVALVVAVSAWMTYTFLTEATDPANQQRLEEVEREAADAAPRDTLAR